MESSLISTSNQDVDHAGLSSITDPLSDDGHVLRVQARESGVGVNAPYLLVYLSQSGTTDIAVLNVTQGVLTTTFTIYEYALTQTEASNIVDYSDLEIRMEASCNSGTCNAGGSRDTVQVSWVEFAVLDDPIIPPPTLDTVTVVNSTSLQIDWSAPVDLSNVLSYDIQRSNGTAFNTIGNVLNGTLSFTEIGLIPDTFYTYQIISKGSSAESLPSNEVSQRTTLILFSSSPDSNIGARWVNGLGNPPCSDLDTFECINENERDDGDFIQTTGLGTSNTDTDSFTMSDMEDPLRSDSHFLKYTLRKAGVGDNPVEFDIVLRQGATTIVSYNHTGLSQNYLFFQQELTENQANQITDYNDLEIEIIGSCDSGCTNQEREKINVSFIIFEIEQVTAPTITTIDTLSSTSLRLSWENEIDAEIIDIIIQRENGTGFLNIGNVTTSIFTFDDTGLPTKSIIKYRLSGMLSSGFSKPSIQFSGATPPSSTELNTEGATVEPSANNSFTKEQREIFVQTTEHFNIPHSIIALIITDIETNQLNAFETIDKMNNGSYGVSQQVENAGAYYGTRYIEIGDISQFLQIITDEIRVALGGSNGTGDNPNFGVIPPET